MFFGSYEHNLDEKGRLVVPSRFREEAGNKLFIMKGFDGALSVYKEADFLALIQEVESLPFNQKKSRDYIRVQLASTVEMDVDKQGRIQLPAVLLNKYHIGKAVIVIGVGNHFEIWDQVHYQEYESQVDQDFETNAEEIHQDE